MGGPGTGGSPPFWGGPCPLGGVLGVPILGGVSWGGPHHGGGSQKGVPHPSWVSPWVGCPHPWGGDPRVVSMSPSWGVSMGCLLAPNGVSPSWGCPRLGAPRLSLSIPVGWPHGSVAPMVVSMSPVGCPHHGVAPWVGCLSPVGCPIAMGGSPGSCPCPGGGPQAQEARACASSSLKEWKRRSSQAWLPMHSCTTSSWPRSSARPSIAVVSSLQRRNVWYL